MCYFHLSNHDSMAFGLVFLDHGGEVWTVDVRLPGAEKGGRALVFSRPSFLAPTEQRALDQVPPCWPNCCSDELRDFLAAARATSS